jgi:hypothetical protein
MPACLVAVAVQSRHIAAPHAIQRPPLAGCPQRQVGALGILSYLRYHRACVGPRPGGYARRAWARLWGAGEPQGAHVERSGTARLKGADGPQIRRAATVRERSD